MRRTRAFPDASSPALVHNTFHAGEETNSCMVRLAALVYACTAVVHKNKICINRPAPGCRPFILGACEVSRVNIDLWPGQQDAQSTSTLEGLLAT